MGKVKRVRAAQLTIQSYVSIPYGKGKALKDPEGAVVHSYQFPMGKVKEEGDIISLTPANVSIPYGKGKVIKSYLLNSHKTKYQFPMGKVKKIGTGFFKPFAALSINSLWER